MQAPVLGQLRNPYSRVLPSDSSHHIIQMQQPPQNQQNQLLNSQFGQYDDNLDVQPQDSHPLLS